MAGYKYTIFIGLLLLYCCSDFSKQAGVISYNTHIRPILSDKCFTCHGPDANQRQSGYRLDTEEGAFAALKDETDKYGLVPGHPERSEVFLRISATDPGYMMPPPESNLSLTADEIALIKQWIAQGAPYQPHWAFIPIEQPALPKVKNKKWPRNEIDYFVLDKMSRQGLSPAPPEEKERILRRLMHDITGLPPSLELQDAFLKDQSPDAYEKVVDQALASAHYGEKMAVLWMDLARYADSHGYQDDGLRTMWPWRDWVIHAFNSNYDYKKFITWQLAGDLVPEKSKETILATGFNRNHKITQEGGVIDEEYRVEYVADRTNTFSKGLLAMTFECAKCHDHKYDPISQKDYYATFAFFNQVNEKGLVGDISLASLADPPYLTITNEDKASILAFISKADTMDVRVMIMKDSSVMRPTYVLDRGLYDRRLEEVEPSTPESILKFDAAKYDKNRHGLAQWMFDDQNPLTARVFVNLMWQEFFGNGIVKTSGDFGLQGDLPTHPELLDWLAWDFKAHGWDIKRLVKQIVMSSTYRQSSAVHQASLAKDPENVYLSRGPRHKLTAELLKDHILASSGLLHAEIGGPSVKPYQPKGLWEAATSGRGQLATYVQDHGTSLYRRGLYHFIKRTVPPPSMLIFDASNRDQCEVRRSNTNTPLQALVMMNDVQILEAAAYLAGQLSQEQGSPEARIETAFRRIVCRRPNPKEKRLILDYYQSNLMAMTEEKAEKLLSAGESKQENLTDLTATASLMQTIQLIYNLEESSIR
jgi:hypothetical protein